MELLLSEATLRVGIEIADDLVPVCLVPLELFAEISHKVETASCSVCISILAIAGLAQVE